MTDDELCGVIQNLNPAQRTGLEKYLAYHIYDDVDDSDIEDIKRNAYNLYRSTISDLIAKIEVYAHELPIPVYGMIENVVRIHAILVQMTEKNEVVKGYEQLIQYEKFFINILYLKLIKLYVSQTKKYIKILKTFNHKGIEIEGEPILRVAKRYMNDAISCLHKGERKLKNIYSIGWFQLEKLLDDLPFMVGRFVDRDIDVQNENSQIIDELAEACRLAETVVNLCEANYADIVNNGYTATWQRRFVYALPGWISFLLALYGTLSIFYKIVGK